MLVQRNVNDTAVIGTTVARWQDLRTRWWAARGRQLHPWRASPMYRSFLADLLERLLPIGLARVTELEMAERVVAVEISLMDSRRLYAWTDGYDPAYASLGLGKLGVAEGVRWSIETGRELYDFMVGDESYKYQFGAQDRYCDWIMLGTDRPRSRLAGVASAAREASLGLTALPGVHGSAAST